MKTPNVSNTFHLVIMTLITSSHSHSQIPPFTHTHRVGRYYGYPDCCVREFYAILSEKDPYKIRRMRQEKAINYYVSQKSGFIPCDKHAMKLYRGTIDLTDLLWVVVVQSRLFSKRPLPTMGFFRKNSRLH